MGALRKMFAQLLLATMLSAQGCGGGGGGGSGGGDAAPTSPALEVAIAIASAPNVQPITVNAGLANSIDLPFISVTLCAPGSSSNCQTIDNLILDTGSSGLRVFSTLVDSLALPLQKDANGFPVAECAQFADGSTWGSIRLADLKIAGEQASMLPIQVIGDPAIPAAPSKCTATGPLKTTAQDLHANGILGVGMFRQDCGVLCETSSTTGLYYVCPSKGCQTAAVRVALQVQNPVSMFAADNNGIYVELPSVPADGAAIARGALVFGIDTQANNALANATVITVSPTNARVTTVYNGIRYSNSFLDSGSNGLFFQDAGIPICSDTSAAPRFYCPATTKNASATIQGRNGASVVVNFSLANADSLLANNPGAAAFNNLGAPQAVANSFDWGLPFFFGRKVYLAIEGANTSGGLGPYVAF